MGSAAETMAYGCDAELADNSVTGTYVDFETDENTDLDILKRLAIIKSSSHCEKVEGKLRTQLLYSHIGHRLLTF